VADGIPAAWSRYGGQLASTGDAASGAHAACHRSSTAGAKWIYQVVPVSPGGWYAAGVHAGVEGTAEAGIRVSWYATADGSGQQLSQDESPRTRSATWTAIAAGPLQAPAGANSARFRLMTWPDGTASGCFDDAFFVASAPAQPEPASAEDPSGSPAALPAGHGDSPTDATSGNIPHLAGPAAPRPPSNTSLRLSEVLSDPAEPGRDAPYEWVELVNFGTEPIDLAEWVIEDGSARDTLPALLVPAGGYVLIAGPTAAIPSGVLAVSPADGEIGNGLGNSGDHLRLFAPDGTVVDEMSYGENTSVFDPPPAAPEAGQTIGVDGSLLATGEAEWTTTLRPTPGGPNVFARAPQATATGPNGEPLGDGAATDAANLLDGGDDQGPNAPVVILFGILGLSAGITATRAVPIIRRTIEARRAR